MDSAGLMAKLNPVPLAPCRRSWRERRHRTVLSAPSSAFRFDTGMELVKMEAAFSEAHIFQIPGGRVQTRIGISLVWNRASVGETLVASAAPFGTEPGGLPAQFRVP